ncbi:hypothetical protein chiPu_0032925, partial [Chiloscyllium punctatum]|nr:hypothetical protein [Chiloscyllium punctatum]
SSYFDRDDVALRHFAEFFKEQSHEEQEHAEKLMEFQNKRGGRVLLQDVKVGFGVCCKWTVILRIKMLHISIYGFYGDSDTTVL